MNPQKCEFLKPEVTFLDHRCTDKGLLPDNDKIEAIKKYPRPTDKDATRRLVAFANYYRRFIENFAKLVQPLNKLTRKKVDFVWSFECETAFQTLKSRLASPPILRYPNFDKSFCITVDASNTACGAVLSQDFYGEDLPFFYASKSFNKAEQNKSTIEKELIAIHFAVNQFRPYIYGTQFTVRSDHRPLIYLYQLKNPSSKLTRLRLDLEEYSFIIEHIKGKDNVAADALSRISIDDLKEIYKDSVSVLPVITRSMTRRANEKTQEDIIQAETPMNDSEMRIIEEFNSNFVKSIPRIRCTNLRIQFKDNAIYVSKQWPTLCAFVKHKRILHVDLRVMFVNEKLKLDLVLSRLQKEADKLNIERIQWPTDDEIFSHFTIDEFKHACRKHLVNHCYWMNRKRLL